MNNQTKTNHFQKKWWILLILVIILVIIFVSNQTKTSEKIKVGGVFPMSGFGQMYGEETQKGFSLCQNDNIELIIEDSQFKGTVGISAFNKLITTDKPDIVIVMVSAVAESTLPLVKNYSGPVLATAVSAANIAERGGSNYFRYFTRGENESVMAGEYLLNNLNIKKLGLLYLNSDYGKVYLDGISKVYSEEGQVIVESFNSGTTDFRTSIAKLKEAGAEGIYFVGYDNDLLLALKNVKEMKYTGIVFANSIFNNLLFKDDINKNILENVYFSGLEFFTSSDKSDPFYSDFKNKYGSEPMWYAAIGCDIARLINKAPDTNLLEYFSRLSSFKGLNGKIVSTDREFEILENVAIYKNGTINVLQTTK
jgi:branched-chain amino acid transport system substrate-binding protein